MDKRTLLLREVATVYRTEAGGFAPRRLKLPPLEITTEAIVGPEQVAAIFRTVIADRPQEVFVVFLLDGRHRLVGWQVTSTGTLTASLVHPREVFGLALRQSAAAVILAHNHPSGHAGPSAEDRQVTRRLQQAGELLGVPMLDHVIVGGDCHVSLRADAAQGWPD